MKSELNKSRVKGFLDVSGRKIINEDGEEIILAGWGLGNWLLCEGYMWLSHSERFDRPRRIEAVIEELTGKEYAASFWQRFRENYITEEDIRLMSEMGYNSVRIPINYRLFMEDGPELRWVDIGFELLNNALDWCEKYGLYAFIDLHGAPGGQTGANIDDSIDDVARLFLDKHCFDKGVALWAKLANVCRDRWIVGGYDILNEPLRPVRFDGDKNLDFLLPKLMEFYETAIKVIREVDEKHIITLEGHHWASSSAIFCKKYDSKMVIHFHRYACLPDIGSFNHFIELSKKWDCPLWLGETGENILEWYSAMYPLSAELGIGFNIWPWKKMECTNSPCSVTSPEGWDKILEYINGGKHPGYAEAKKILDQYIEKIKIENCVINNEITSHIFRLPGCTIRGTDFDEIPGKGVTCSGLKEEENFFGYRNGMGMEIVEKFPDMKKKFGFDCRWNRFVLKLSKDEFACYTLYDATAQSRVEIACYSAGASCIEVYQDNEFLGSFTLGGLDEIQIIGSLRTKASPKSVIRIKVLSGCAEVDSVITSVNRKGWD